MRIHILGICGTFMGGLAMIARQLGFEVSGSDQNVYPPMSDALQAAGIVLQEGYDPAHLQPPPDRVIVGNTISRGNAALEYVLNKDIPYTSGPQWLAENVLAKRHVLAVSGTHGKTTTTALLMWIMTKAGLKPGYLVGGVAQGFAETAALGESPYFVIEADEYDSAFFDKRSKFIHYRPKTLILNNLEYDHADIFPDLEAIKRQFQNLLRVVPARGTVILPADDENLREVVARGCWAAQQLVGAPNGTWQARNQNTDGSTFELWHRDQKLGLVHWALVGEHNIKNALAAAAAAHDVGVTGDAIIAGLNSFKGVKRRLEVRGCVNGITVYDDFAHHPTAIQTTLAGLRAKVGKDARIFAVLQFGSNTMASGVHSHCIAPALEEADRILLLKPNWNIEPILKELGKKVSDHADVQAILDNIIPDLSADDHVLIMSNKGFDGIHLRLLKALQGIGVV